MKTTSKLARTIGGGLTMLGMIIAAATPSFALTSTATNTNSTSTGCAHITTLASTSTAAISEKIGLMNTDFQTHLSTISSNQTAIDQKVATARQNLTTQFEAKVQTMLNQANLTEVQKKAIATYQTTVESAEKTRENSVDQARDAYRTALLLAVQTYQTDLTDATTAFQNSTTADFTTAQTTCGDGTALTTLKAAVKTDRATYASARSAARTTADIKQLITVRNGLIKTADTTFASTVEKATATLSAVLTVTTAQ